MGYIEILQPKVLKLLGEDEYGYALLPEQEVSADYTPYNKTFLDYIAYDHPYDYTPGQKTVNEHSFVENYAGLYENMHDGRNHNVYEAARSGHDDVAKAIYTTLSMIYGPGIAANTTGKILALGGPRLAALISGLLASGAAYALEDKLTGTNDADWEKLDNEYKNSLRNVFGGNIPSREQIIEYLTLDNNGELSKDKLDKLNPNLLVAIAKLGGYDLSPDSKTLYYAGFPNWFNEHPYLTGIGSAVAGGISGTLILKLIERDKRAASATKIWNFIKPYVGTIAGTVTGGVAGTTASLATGTNKPPITDYTSSFIKLQDYYNNKFGGVRSANKTPVHLYSAPEDPSKTVRVFADGTQDTVILEPSPEITVPTITNDTSNIQNSTQNNNLTGAQSQLNIFNQ